MIGTRYVNTPKHKQSERILCGVFTKLHGSSTTNVYCDARLLCCPVFVTCVNFIHCAITYGFPVLLPGISTRHPICRYILKYDGL